MMIAAVVFILGLIFGSFSTAIIHRIPDGKPWILSRSACTRCGKALTGFDLLPVLSWCFSRGRCRHCKGKISLVYPVIEFSSALACLCVYLFLGISFYSILVIVSVPFLIALFVIDIQKMLLPDVLTIILAFLGLVNLGWVMFTRNDFFNTSIEHIGGAVVFAFVLWISGYVLEKLMKKPALGFGDVKFFGVAGLWLGLSALPVYFMISGVLGVVFGFLWRIAGRGDLFPFGPAIIAAFYVLLIFKGQYGIVHTDIIFSSHLR
jgi:prepilin signal peptidase PulO-like enzyme (type II secretory pathway)